MRFPQPDISRCVVVTEIGAERDDLALSTMTSNIFRLLKLPVHGSVVNQVQTSSLTSVFTFIITPFPCRVQGSGTGDSGGRHVSGGYWRSRCLLSHRDALLGHRRICHHRPGGWRRRHGYRWSVSSVGYGMSPVCTHWAWHVLIGLCPQARTLTSCPGE